MEENELLKKFYNDEFKNIHDPEFKDLEVEYKKALSKSTQFAFYKASQRFREFTEAVNKAFLNVKLK
jgi:hypothetical protein